MPEETATPQPSETSPEATAPAQAKPDDKPQGFDDRAHLPGDQRPPDDWHYAYSISQRNQDKLHTRVNDVLAQNRALADTVKFLKESQQAILKQTVGEDEAKAIEDRQRTQQERDASLQAAQALEQSLAAAVTTMDRVLDSAGLTKDDRLAIYAQAREYDGAQWFDAVHQLASARLAKTIETRITKAKSEVEAKSKAEIKEEAEALADRKLKAADVDKVDLARGSGTSSLAQRISDMDPMSPEFHKLLQQAKAGKLRI